METYISFTTSFLFTQLNKKLNLIHAFMSKVLWLTWAKVDCVKDMKDRILK